MTDQSKIAKIESDAKRELHGLKYKKATVTRNMNLCLTLLEACKGEIRSTVPLSKKSAEDTMTQYNRAQISLNDLEASMERYPTKIIPCCGYIIVVFVFAFCIEINIIERYLPRGKFVLLKLDISPCLPPNHFRKSVPDYIELWCLQPTSCSEGFLFCKPLVM